MKHKLINQCTSIINICDNMKLDIKYNVVNHRKHFYFYVNALYSINLIKFDDLTQIIKAFNKNNLFLCDVLLNRLIQQTKNKLHFYLTS